MTMAPSSRRRVTVAAPIPEPAPVTMTLRSENRCMSGHLESAQRRSVGIGGGLADVVGGVERSDEVGVVQWCTRNVERDAVTRQVVDEDVDRLVDGQIVGAVHVLLQLVVIGEYLCRPVHQEAQVVGVVAGDDLVAVL